MLLSWVSTLNRQWVIIIFHLCSWINVT